MIEYKVVTLRNNDAVDTDDLNALAREGWRVVTCTHMPLQGILTILSREQASVVDPRWPDADRDSSWK